MSCAGRAMCVGANSAKCERWTRALTLCVKLCATRSEEHTSELQSPCNLVCRLLLEKKDAPMSAGHAARARPIGLAAREQMYVPARRGRGDYSGHNRRARIYGERLLNEQLLARLRCTTGRDTMSTPGKASERTARLGDRATTHTDHVIQYEAHNQEIPPRVPDIGPQGMLINTPLFFF